MPAQISLTYPRPPAPAARCVGVRSPAPAMPSSLARPFGRLNCLARLTSWPSSCRAASPHSLPHPRCFRMRLRRTASYCRTRPPSRHQAGTFLPPLSPLEPPSHTLTRYRLWLIGLDICNLFRGALSTHGHVCSPARGHTCRSAVAFKLGRSCLRLNVPRLAQKWPGNEGCIFRCAHALSRPRLHGRFRCTASSDNFPLVLHLPTLVTLLELDIRTHVEWQYKLC